MSSNRGRSDTRFCVFCGQPPENKTNEHIVPRWLISLTGDPKRQMQLGPFINQKNPFLQFAFDQFQFPACNKCNEAFSALESRAKIIMESLLNLAELSSLEFDVLLDWFDKVRVGLWLGYQQLDKNYFQITPNFHIVNRIAAADRVLLIYRTTSDRKGLYFLGVNTPAFAHAPVCFTLLANHLVFMNVSTHFLLSRRAGLPYPKSVLLGDGGQVTATLQTGTESIDYPVMGYNYNRNCTIIAQPIYRLYADAYTDEYSKNMSLAPGRIWPIIQTPLSVELYSNEQSRAWIPQDIYDPYEVLLMSALQTFQMQSDLLSRMRHWKGTDKSIKQRLNYDIKQCIEINKRFSSIARQEITSLKGQTTS